MDCVQSGHDDITVYVIHDGASFPYEMQSSGTGSYKVHFTPVDKGSYTVSVFSGGIEVPGNREDMAILRFIFLSL